MKKPLIISFASIKGGVGKSTTALVFSKILSENSKVLLLDLDAQTSLTSFFAKELEKNKIEVSKNNIFEVLMKRQRLSDIILEIDKNLDFVPSYLKLSVFNRVQMNFKEERLSQVLLAVKNNYDFILIDTNPSLDYTLTNALLVSDALVVPVPASKWAIESYEILEEQVNELESDKPDFKLPLFILNTMLRNSKSSDFYFDFLKKQENFLGSIKHREDLHNRIDSNEDFDKTKDYYVSYEEALKILLTKI